MRRRYASDPFHAGQDGLWTQVVLLERKFRAEGIILRPEANYPKIVPGRQYEADAAIPSLKIAIEYQGGAFMKKSGHTNLQGVRRDHYKANAAQLNGWLFLQFGPIETRTGEAMNVIECAIRYRVKSALRCRRCGVGLDNDNDGNCAVCAKLSDQ